MKRKLESFFYFTVSKKKTKDDVNISNYLSEIKSKILNKTGSTLLTNKLSNINNFFVYQPYGTHNFPDFLVFNNKKIFSLEIKFTEDSAGHPVWNSNLPKSDALYIFGSRKRKDVTFFRGEDVLKDNDRKLIFEAMEKAVNSVKEIFDSIPSNEYGFGCYFRRAFIQTGEEGITNLFSNTKRNNLEKSLIEWVDKQTAE